MARRRESTLADLDHAIEVVASVIRTHPLGQKALPIFARLERERARLAQEAEMMERANAFSGKERGASGPH